MKHLAYAALAAAILSGCGGGSGSPGATGSNAPSLQGGSTSNTQLDAYVGTWASDCADHAVDTATIARASGSPATVTIAVKTDYYAGATCTGNIVATMTSSADVSATYAGTVDTSIVFTPGAAAVAAKVDKISATLPQHTVSITGTGVMRSVTANGQAQWCINYGSGSSNCIVDQGTYPAQNGLDGGLYVQNNVLYELEPSGSVYTVDERFTKR